MSRAWMDAATAGKLGDVERWRGRRKARSLCSIGSTVAPFNTLLATDALEEARLRTCGGGPSRELSFQHTG